jgi:hypothetical protein
MTAVPPRLQVQEPPFPFSNRLLGNTKQNFEIVIARYDEDIRWSDNYKAFRTVYNKGTDVPPYPHIQLENKGHLADTILRHILANYDRLADVTFFTHGSFNYRPDQIIRAEGACVKRWYEYIRLDPDTLEYIPRRDIHPSQRFYGYEEDLASVYKRIFGRDYTSVPVWGCGKIVSVGRQRIHNSPKSVYQAMLDFVLEPYKGEEPSQDIYRTRGIYIERLFVEAFRKKSF